MRGTDRCDEIVRLIEETLDGSSRGSSRPTVTPLNGRSRSPGASRGASPVADMTDRQRLLVAVDEFMTSLSAALPAAV